MASPGPLLVQNSAGSSLAQASSTGLSGRNLTVKEKVTQLASPLAQQAGVEPLIVVAIIMEIIKIVLSCTQQPRSRLLTPRLMDRLVVGQVCRRHLAFPQSHQVRDLLWQRGRSLTVQEVDELLQEAST